MSSEVEVNGVFGGVRWRSGDGDFMIGYLSDQGKTAILGDAPEGKLITGVEYRFSGKWHDDPRFGQQFKFNGFVQLQPHTRRGVVNYLEKYAHGIGPAIAARLFDKYGPDAVMMLRSKPYECVKEIDRLGLAAAEKASADLEAIAESEGTMIELANLLNGRGFAGAVTDAVYGLWGASAPEVIQRDPYKLMLKQIKSCGFGRCDRLYLDLGHDPGKLKRQTLCLWNLIRTDTSGSTWHKADGIYSRLGQEVNAERLQPEKATKLGVRSGLLAIHDGMIAERVKADQEERVAKKIMELVSCQGKKIS